jgi:hypothetical protein
LPDNINKRQQFGMKQRLSAHQADFIYVIKKLTQPRHITAENPDISKHLALHQWSEMTASLAF